MKKIASLVFLLMCSSLAWATVCPTGAGYAKVFIIDPNVTQGTTLTSFPVPLTFNGATLGLNGIQSTTSVALPDLKATGLGGKVQSTSGYDIWFCTSYSGGTLLNFERVLYVPTTGEAEFYVSQTVSSSAPTYIWMFYGKGSDTDHSSAAAVWSSASYVYVNHFPNGSSLSVADSTGNTTPTNHGATAAAGFVAGGANFVSASTQYIDAGAAVSPTPSMTLEAWANFTSTALSACEAGITNDVVNGIGFVFGTGGCASTNSIEWAGCVTAGCGTVSYLFTQNGLIPPNTWNFYEMTAGASSSSANFQLFLNGIQVTTFALSQYQGSLTASTAHLTIGADSTGAANLLNGTLDEVRISSVIESPAWLAANAAAQSNPSSFAVMVDAITPAGMAAGANCVPVVINASQVTATQTDFPLMVRGIYPWMADVADGGYAVNGNSGRDIRWFADSACTATPLNFQRTFWTNTTGDSKWRIHLPTVSSSSNTTVYAKIGSPGDSTDLSAPWMGTFGHVGVYEGGNETTLGTADSGSANLDLSESAVGTVTGAISIVGGGFFANNTTGAPSPLNSLGWGPSTVGDSIGSHGYPTGSGIMHQRVWFRAINLTAQLTDQTIVGFGKGNGTGQNGLGIDYASPTASSSGNFGTGMVVLGFTSPNPTLAATSPTQTPTPSSPTFRPDYGWHVLDFDFPTVGGAMTTTALYVDGVSIGTPVCELCSTVINTDNSPGISGEAEIRMFRVAAHGVDGFTGYVAQWEISNVSRSASYVATRYNNESDPSTFYSFGTATPIVPPMQNQTIINIVKLERSVLRPGIVLSPESSFSIGCLRNYSECPKLSRFGFCFSST